MNKQKINNTDLVISMKILGKKKYFYIKKRKISI